MKSVMCVCSTIITQNILCNFLHTAFIYKDAGNNSTSQLRIWYKMTKAYRKRKQIVIIVIVVNTTMVIQQTIVCAMGNIELKSTPLVTIFLLMIIIFYIANVNAAIITTINSNT